MSFFQALLTDVRKSTVDLLDGWIEFTGAQIKGAMNSTTYKFFSPTSMWHDGKTYAVYPDESPNPPYGQARMLIFDEEAGFDRPYNVGQVMSGAETHQVPVIVVDDNDALIVCQENVHSAPVEHFHGIDGGDWNVFSKSPGGAIGSTLAYPNPLRLASGNFVLYSRGTTDFDIYVTKAASGFSTWGTPRKTSDAGASTLYRHYPCMPYAHGFNPIGGWFYIIIGRRVDDGIFNGVAKWYRYYVLKTQDFDTFENYGGTHSHEIAVDGVLTEAILIANYTAYGHAEDKQGFDPTFGISPAGELYGIQGNATEDGYVFIYWNGSAWATRPVEIDNLWEIPDYDTHQWSPMRYIIPYSVDDIQLVADLTIGAETKQKWFRTTNQGVTWQDLGFVVPEAFVATEGRIILPQNIHDIPNDRNFGVWFTAIDAITPTYTKVFGKVGVKGTLQAIPGLTITPASSMSRATGNVFHYKCIDGQMGRTGNNVTSLTDQFGLRTAFGTGNPQWDGVNAVNFNGTSNYFAISATGLTGMTHLTILAVVKVAAATRGIIVSFSKNSTSTDYLEYLINETDSSANGGNKPTVTNRSVAASTTYISGDDGCADGNWHVMAFVTDAVSKHDIYVDGKFQYLNRGGVTNLVKFQQIGDSVNAISTVNTIRIASRDISGTDLFTPLGLKEIVCYNAVLPIAELREKIKKLCNDHSITYLNQFKIPVV